MVNKKNGGSKKGGGKEPPIPPMGPVDGTSGLAESAKVAEANQSQTNNQVTETAIIDLTRALVRWTARLTFATVLLGIVAVFQWNELRKTDDHIAEQVQTANSQLKEMHDTGVQTETLIATNKKLAEAATQSAAIAEKSMEISQRAYFNIAAKITKFEKSAFFEGSLVASNVGSTPAYSAKLKTIMAIVDYPLPDNISLPDIISTPVTEALVSKNELIKGSIVSRTTISDEDFDAVNNGNGRRIILYGDLKFRDAFNCQIERKVCYFYNGDAIKSGEGEICGGGRNVETYEGACGNNATKQ